MASIASAPAATRLDPETVAAARDGALAIAPFVVGFAPFALVIGATVAASAHEDAGVAASWLVYGGSAQLALQRTLESGGAVLAVVAALLINTRLAVYSASLARQWSGQPRWFRISAAPLLVDPVWAVAERNAVASTSPRAQRAHYFGAALSLFVAWSVLIAVGVIAGNQLSGVGLEVAAPLCLLALVGPKLKDPRTRAVVFASAAVAVLGRGLPAGTSILAAIACGIAVGVSMDNVANRSKS
jgi:predicted branched-subunit amino acid permease